MSLKNVFFSFLLLILLFSNFSYSQKYNSVDSIVIKYQKHFDTPKQLADQIQKDFYSENNKARAIYTWMALNISYDVKTWLNPKPIQSITYKTQLEKDLKLQEIKNKTVKAVFKKQLAVCSGYSLLFNHLATLVGLKSDIITGMAKTTPDDIGRRKPIMNHAWNSVMIDGTWRLIDVTWGAGYIANKQNLWVKEFSPFYFDTPSKIFFTKHLPASRVWLNESIDEEFFLKAPLLFDEYVDEYYEILEPKIGVIEAVENQKIVFRIKNLSRLENLFYTNKYDVPTQIKPSKDENNILVFDIIYHRRDGRYITLFVDGKAISTFKIIPKSEIKKR
jgi:transglutaminase/protease-like cytokinesis protein 3